MTRLSLIVISDLHAGAQNPYAELRTAPGTASIACAHHTLAALCEAISEVAVTDPAGRVLVCAGDLSSQCHSAELEKAGVFLEAIAGRLSIPRNQRFLVPGNHDIDWPLTRLGAERDPWYDSLRQLKFEQLIKAHAPSFAFCSGGQPLRAELPHQTHLFLLDSPWDDKSTNNPHHGRLGQQQLARLRTLLSETPPESTRLVLLHHHVSPQGWSHDSTSDFSQVQDAGELLDLMRSERVSFVVHGHQHRFNFHQIVATPQPVSVLCSGSTTIEYDGLPTQVPNAFHVVNFDSLAPETICGSIHTRVFSFMDGWIRPNRTQQRLGSRVPFGHSATPADAAQWATDILAACRARKFVRIDPFIRSRPRGQYYDPDDFKRLLAHRIASESLSDKFEIHFNQDHECWQLELVEGADAAAN